MIFVDDACPEGSASLLAELARADPRVRVLSLPRNQGQQRAVWSGLHVVRGRVIVVMDADLQDPPEAVPRLLDRLEGGRAAAVFAGRQGSYESPGRLLTSRLFKWTLARLTGVPGDAGLYLAMRRSLVDLLLASPADPTHLVARIGCLGVPVDSVPVMRARRPVGRSAYSSLARARIGLAAVWQTLRTRSRRGDTQGIGS
jgi:glycosyltransferase involved in cell wall biosynthesis